jgi:site-specific recombinase XerC
LDRQSGLRWAELGNLLVKHVQDEFMEVRKGKGDKDRVIPLTATMFQRLQQYIENNHLKPEDRLFGLPPGSISNRFRQITDKAVGERNTYSLFSS